MLTEKTKVRLPVVVVVVAVVVVVVVVVVITAAPTTTTPTSYLELINLYLSMLTEKTKLGCL